MIDGRSLALVTMCPSLACEIVIIGMLYQKSVFFFATMLVAHAILVLIIVSKIIRNVG